MKTIGIICATDDELEPVLKNINEEQIQTKAMLTFHQGKIGVVPVVLVFSGVCKVNAAVATQILIDAFNVDIIINGGTAGGMDPSINLLDTVISERVCYHDVGEDILTEYHPYLETVFFHGDAKLLAIAKEYNQDLKHKILFGITVSGEQFIEDEKRDEINERFHPLSVDMETAGVAHVCYVNNVPFMAVRTITDTADHKGVENFDRNCEAASKISAEVIVGMLEKLAA